MESGRTWYEHVRGQECTPRVTYSGWVQLETVSWNTADSCDVKAPGVIFWHLPGAILCKYDKVRNGRYWAANAFRMMRRPGEIIFATCFCVMFLHPECTAGLFTKFKQSNLYCSLCITLLTTICRSNTYVSTANNVIPALIARIVWLAFPFYEKSTQHSMLISATVCVYVLERTFRSFL